MEIYKDLTQPINKPFEKLLDSQLSKNKIDEALGMIQAANLADQDTRKRLLEKATQIFLGLSGESIASQDDVNAIVGGAKS